MIKRLLSLLIIGYVFICTVNADEFHQGPIRARNQDMFDLIYLTFEAESPETLTDKQTAWGYSIDITNEAKVGQYATFDYEMERFELRHRIGMRNNTELQFTLPVTLRNGGFMDWFLDWWHRSMFASYPPARQVLPKYEAKIVVAKDGHAIVNAGSAEGLGDINITYKKQLWKKESSSGAFRVGLELPTGNSSEYLGSGGIDAGVSLDAYWKISPDFRLYASSSLVRQDGGSHLPNTREWIVHNTAALEWLFTRRDSIVVQIDDQPNAWTSGDPRFDRRHRVIIMGWKRLMSKDSQLVISYSEDNDYTGNTLSEFAPDFSGRIYFEQRY